MLPGALLFLVVALAPGSYISVVHFPEFDLMDELFGDEVREGQYYRMIDEDGKILMITGRRLQVGDTYLTGENKLYEVFEVEEFTARVRQDDEFEFTGGTPFAASLQGDGERPVQAEIEPSFLIGIYHSHNAESYVPSEGTDSIYGKGGIHRVGRVFKESLEEKGVNVIHSERLHLPHDRGAYRRSRITALNILARGPDAIFDVHRDAAPWEAYAGEIEGENVSQIMMVVGRANPNVAVNRNFAYDLKGYTDRIYPGLVRGVLVAWGNYNQDLTPLSLLLEVGAHTNTRESAERGISFFADIVAFYFYGPEFLDGEGERRDREALPPALYRDAGGISTAISGTVVSLLLGSLVAALGFYFLNNPQAGELLQDFWKELPERLELTFKSSKEFIHYLPGHLAVLKANFPRNLRFAWNDLAEESRRIPEVLTHTKRNLQVYISRQVASIPEKMHNIRHNWREAQRVVREEALYLWKWLLLNYSRLKELFKIKNN